MLKEFLAELVGTAVLLMFGCGCVAQSVLSGGANGGMLSINIGWGLGVLIGVLVAGPISGAHLNPAVSVSLACVKKFPLSSLGHYLAGQYLGAFLGSSLVLFTYRDALHHFSGGRYVVAGENATAGIFVTFPAEGVTNFGGAVDQVIGTALLLLSVSAVGFHKNSKISTSLGPLLVALTVVAIGVCFGHNAGYAINPARDLGPRIMISLCGWGTEAFSSHGWWFWIPVVCCHLGGVVGVVVHTVVIEHQWGTESKAAKEETGMEKEETQLTAEV